MITCRDCGAGFLFSESEQNFYVEKGLRMSPRGAQNAELQGRISSAAAEAIRNVRCSRSMRAMRKRYDGFLPAIQRQAGYCKDCFQPPERSRNRY